MLLYIYIYIYISQLMLYHTFGFKKIQKYFLKMRVSEPKII